MILEVLSFGPFETNIYVVGCPNTKSACIIDAPVGCISFVNAIVKKHGLSVTQIMLTHAHIDHIAEAITLKETFQVPVSIHKFDAPGLLHPRGMEMSFAFHSVEGMSADAFLEDEDRVCVGELSFEVLFTPGHSPGSICFYDKNRKILFSGDTLFKGCMGRVDLPGSNPNSMWKSLKKLSTLPSETRVFPGHGSDTTIGAESWMEDAESIFSGGND